MTGTKRTAAVAASAPAAPVDILDKMAAGIMGNKARAAAKLTPTTAEKAAAPGWPVGGDVKTYAPFPYDDLNMIEGALTRMEQAANDVLDQVRFVRQGLQLIRDAEPQAKAAEAARKQAEREADERAAIQEREAIQSVAKDDQEDFEAEMAAKAAAAQAATFKQAEPDGWACPEHGGFVEKTSGKGRKYRGCSECDEFERL